MKVIDVNKSNFDEEVLKSTTKVLVDFNADWCGPCKMLRPVLDEIAESNDNIKIVSINVDFNNVSRINKDDIESNILNDYDLISSEEVEKYFKKEGK